MADYFHISALPSPSALMLLDQTPSPRTASSPIWGGAPVSATAAAAAAARAQQFLRDSKEGLDELLRPRPTRFAEVQADRCDRFSGGLGQAIVLHRKWRADCRGHCRGQRMRFLAASTLSLPTDTLALLRSVCPPHPAAWSMAPFAKLSLLPCDHLSNPHPTPPHALHLRLYSPQAPSSPGEPSSRADALAAAEDQNQRLRATLAAMRAEMVALQAAVATPMASDYQALPPDVAVMRAEIQVRDEGWKARCKRAAEALQVAWRWP